MTVTLTLDPVNGTATFSGLTPETIGAISYSDFQQLISLVSGVQTQQAQSESEISGLTAFTGYINSRIDDLTPNSVKLGNIAQNLSNGEISLNSNVFVDGQLTAYAKLETRVSENGFNLQAWTESTKYSSRLDLWSEDSAKEYELSIFRDTYCSNAKNGLAVYIPDNTDTVQTYISAKGNTYLCANNGNVGIGFSTNPSEKLHVNGNIRATSSLKLGTAINQISYASAAPTSGTFKRGDIVFNTAPSASGNVGWVCVSAGSPGTWKTFGTISA